MKIIRLLIKVLTYLWIIFPITRGVLRGILGYRLGGSLVLIAMLIIVYQLEKNKTLDNVLDRIFRNLGTNSKKNTSTLNVLSKSIIGGITESDSLSTIPCHNCGATVEAVNGVGTCKSCDSIIRK